MSNPNSTAIQLRLIDFATEHGRRWRADLRQIWDNGQDAGDQALRMARNIIGPTGLDHYQVPQRTRWNVGDRFLASWVTNGNGQNVAVVVIARVERVTRTQYMAMIESSTDSQFVNQIMGFWHDGRASGATLAEAEPGNLAPGLVLTGYNQGTAAEQAHQAKCAALAEQERGPDCIANHIGTEAEVAARRAQLATEHEQQADRVVALTTANPDMTLGEIEHADGQHLHHEPGCGLCERERLADAAKVEHEAEAVATAADVANSSRPASGRVYDIEQQLAAVERLLLTLAENVTAKGKDMPTAHSINLAVAHLNVQRADLRQLERDLVCGRVRR